MKHSWPFVLFLLLTACGGSPSTSLAPVSILDSLKRDVRVYPDSLLVLENLLQWYRDEGLYDSALTETKRAEKRFSTTSRFWQVRSVLEKESADTAAAIRSLEQAVHLEPDPFYMLSLGNLLGETGDPRALPLADALYQRDPQRLAKESAYINGLYFRRTGNPDAALKAFDQALSYGLTFMEAYREKALTLESLDRVDEAIGVLQKAVTLQNNFEEGYYHLGRMLEKQNRLDEALEAYRWALLYDPDYEEAREGEERVRNR